MAPCLGLRRVDARWGGGGGRRSGTCRPCSPSAGRSRKPPARTPASSGTAFPLLSSRLLLNSWRQPPRIGDERTRGLFTPWQNQAKLVLAARTPQPKRARRCRLYTELSFPFFLYLLSSVLFSHAIIYFSLSVWQVQLRGMVLVKRRRERLQLDLRTRRYVCNGIANALQQQRRLVWLVLRRPQQMSKYNTVQCTCGLIIVGMGMWCLSGFCVVVVVVIARQIRFSLDRSEPATASVKEGMQTCPRAPHPDPGYIQVRMIKPHSLTFDGVGEKKNDHNFVGFHKLDHMTDISSCRSLHSENLHSRPKWRVFRKQWEVCNPNKYRLVLI